MSYFRSFVTYVGLVLCTFITCHYVYHGYVDGLRIIYSEEHMLIKKENEDMKEILGIMQKFPVIPNLKPPITLPDLNIEGLEDPEV